MNQFYIYILTNKPKGTLYVGFTNDLRRRMSEHKNKSFEGFTKKYNLDKLVYFETALTPEYAQMREKRIKKWNRQWKIELIERTNPEWKDLSAGFDKELSNTEKMDLLFGKEKIEVIIK